MGTVLIVGVVVGVFVFGWLCHLAAPGALAHQQEIGDELQPPDPDLPGPA